MGRGRVLVVEDDARLSGVLAGELARLADVDVVGGGADALRRAAETPYDLVVLDLNLPDIDGIHVAEQLHGTGPAILMLTARADVRSRVEGLYAGADDYLAKPFHMEELLARVHARLRTREAPDTVQVGGLELRAGGASCTFEGVSVELAPQEFQLLTLLAAHRGRIFSRADIVERLYDGDMPASNAIEALVSRLRSKLTAAGAARLVETVRGFGYVIR